ncbi:urea transporter [Microtetraspora malaysiensis]|uniref:urea transporter n=1 Tax=Microtetraspora malaysiensis TaxID=161358 RepID=UPI003D8C9EEB
MTPATPNPLAEAMRRPPLTALLPVIRGVGQVDFMASYWAGILFIVALFVGGWQYGMFGLLGSGVATLTAYVFGAAANRIRLGLEGFPGTLIGVAFVLYFGTSWVTMLLTIGGCIGGSVLTSAMNGVLTPYNLPTLTAPFCVITTVMLLATSSFRHVAQGRIGPPPPSEARGAIALSWNEVWQGMFRGIGQVFFQDKWYVGLIFLVGLLVASRVAAAAAVLSSLLGMFVAWALGAPAADVAAGLYGYNAVLTAIALCGVFVVLSPLGVLFAVIGAASATALTAAITNFFLPFGGHTLTWPFVLVTWVFLAAIPVLSRLRRT